MADQGLLHDGYGPNPTAGPLLLDAGPGTITYSYNVTYKFIWVPNGELETEDDPVAQELPFDYTGSLQWTGHSGFDDQSAGCSGSWSLSVTSASGTASTFWNASMTSSPNPEPDPPTITTNGTWGDNAGVLLYTLNGAEIDVTLSIQGSLVTTGVGAGSLTLAAPPVGQAGPEGIWHHFPVQGKTYPVDATLKPRGVWRGLSGQTYRVRLAHKHGPVTGGNETVHQSLPDLAGTGRVRLWDSASAPQGGFVPSGDKVKWWSVAYLDKWNGNAYVFALGAQNNPSDVWFFGGAPVQP